MLSDHSFVPSSSPASRGPDRLACAGLFSRRERWGFTWRGGLAAIGLIAALLFSTFATVHPFLAITDRAPASFLVVEGWVNDAAIAAAVREFTVGGYQIVFTTGGLRHGRVDADAASRRTVAGVGAGRLRAAGVPANLVWAAPAQIASRDRTYASAVALRELLREQKLAPRSLNILTEGPHARRTRLLFQTAFGGTVKIGVIAIPNQDYDPRHWWRSSEGVREVLGESIAYVYAKLLFFPPAILAARDSAAG
jgi:hypothetical protein